MSAMLLARLAARLFGVRFGLALRERSRLSLGRAFEFVDALKEFANSLLQPRVAFTQALILKEELLIRRRVHANLGSDNPCRLNEIVAKRRLRDQRALNKHP
jgi:hypothetical protein